MNLSEKKKKTILVVDDNKTNIDVLKDLLKEYDVITVLNGITAIDIALQETIDLILLDILMPNMDGYEVCKILKSNEFTKKIPIIFLTAKSDEDSIVKAYDVGGTDYVTKPFKPKELLLRIEKDLEIYHILNQKNKSISVSSESLIDIQTDKKYNIFSDDDKYFFDKASQYIEEYESIKKKDLL
ncbi:MAG: hypothetical protein DRG78_11750 [Epsilonproteobacteria bacterium]|nr:MAG: hypothetical protein DRG78_11750 [Campylobacterota bacterium]